MSIPAAPPTWRLVDPPRPGTLDVPEAWAYHGIAALERVVGLADLGHDDFPPRAVDLLVGDLHQEHLRRHRLVAVEVGPDAPGAVPRVVGHGVLTLPVTDNRHLAVVRIAVLPSHRGQGIGSAIADRLRRVALTECRSTVFAEVEFAAEPPSGAPDALAPREGDGHVSADLPGMRFARRAGLGLEIVARRSVLEVPLPDGVVERLATDAAARAGDAYRLHTWQDPVPEAWVEQLAALEQRLSEDEPNGGLALEAEQWDGQRVRIEEAKRAERGQGALVTVAEHVPTGTLAGMTLFIWDADRPEFTEQESTVVLPEHRGHRLGMLLKAVNLREHTRLRPDTRRISTWNNETNAPMLAINVALGFRPAGGAAELQAPLADVVPTRRLAG
ncbi:GNAT family N-acetyltransferase [Krasilnikoviella flava]|uniref:Acetyltransferase (GNAT) family protein n=1 Tax=Krasilnikoviella flava TaxID=526729 RepID=A0A1T5K3N3_9MICO|nr:GNAT family N-acetyltransferase [Krasilnikoviella flava]SKC58306.1 Acetyltransferase (GNAT) family protein [Krasilnikoviella flava]